MPAVYFELKSLKSLYILVLLQRCIISNNAITSRSILVDQYSLLIINIIYD